MASQWSIIWSSTFWTSWNGLSSNTIVLKYPTYERSPDCSGRQFLGDVDSEDGVAQQYADLKDNPCTAVQRQVKAGNVYQHEEDAGDEETHHVQQGASANQHLNKRWALRSDGDVNLACHSEKSTDVN